MRRGTLLTPDMRAEAADAVEWQAELVPLPIHIETHPDARHGAIVIMAGGVSLCARIVAEPPAEPDDVAQFVEDELRRVAVAVGVYPEVLTVRHKELAHALESRLADKNVKMEMGPALPQLEDFVDGLLREVAGVQHGRPPYGSATQVWRAWRLPDKTVASLFSAAAAFYRASPWRWLANEAVFHVQFGGKTWAATVMGYAGEEFGLALYSDSADLEQILAGVSLPDVRFDGRMLGLSFNPRAELPRAMQREIASSQWEVAFPDAYPSLFTLNSLAGGVTIVDAEVLTAALLAFAGYTTQHGSAIATRNTGSYEDTGGARLVPAFEAMNELFTELWEVPETLAPGRAFGALAAPGALLDERAPDVLYRAALPVLERFAAAMEDEFSAATVRKHTENALLFIEFLTRWQGVPLAGVYEYHLRSFLYDWIHRKTALPESLAGAVPVSLTRFFSYIGTVEGLICPWAAVVLSEREEYRIRRLTCPAGYWWDPEVRSWMAELYTDLDARVMLVEPGLADGTRWSGQMHAEEAALHEELQSLVLIWREELIARGITGPGPLRAELVRMQHEWQESPHAKHRGHTPLDVIRKERRES